MSRLLLLADALTPSDTLPGLRGVWATPDLRNRLIMVLAIFLAISVPIIWAVYFRKKPRHRKHRHLNPAPSISAEPGAASESHSRFKRRKRRRRSNHPQRSLNPTLAETGGLPPMRGKDHPGTLP